ncbi:MAG TPA: carbonic anhydrase, partial [Gemmatimonadaceae bacterium]|nr:carbonic anhydrase [Gemmatimonadaceae bacterium]
PLGLIDNWLRHVQDVAARHREALERLPTDTARINRLCELNVLDQVVHVCRTTVLQDAWARGQRVVVHTDLNCLSVLQFAVDVLRVEHVIVCGHYGCGGVAAAWHGRPLGLIDNWLRHVQDVRQKHAVQLDATPAHAREDRMCELNVLEQALNVCETTIVQDAWERGQALAVHAWIYRLDDGLLRDLGFTVESPAEVAAAISAATSQTA